MNLTKLINSITSTENTIEDITRQQKDSIKEIQTIEQYLSILEKEKNRLTTQRRLIFQEISKYSTFNADIIGKALASLLSKTQNDIFKYSIPTFINSYDEYPLLEENSRKKIKTPFRMISKEKTTKTTYNKKDHISGIILDKNEGENLNEELNLYTWDLDLNINKPFINTLKPHYFKVQPLQEEYYKIIKDFIDFLINYRIENQLKEISEEKINELLDKYLAKTKNETKILIKH